MRLFALAALICIVLALTIATAAGAFGGNASPPQGAPPPPTPAELKRLGQMAVKAATLARDPHPTGAVVVPTTRQVAERIDAGAFVNSDPPVYFVLVDGNFTLDAPVPAGAHLPTGTILTMTINPRRNVSLDGGVESVPPDLYAMGQPEPLPLPATG